MQRRRRLALAACLLWIAGFELVPNLHIGFHELLAAHSHGQSAESAAEHYGFTGPRTARRRGPRTERRAHDHAGGEHRHDGDEHAHDHDDGEHSPDHGQGSLAHRGIATLAPPPPVTQPFMAPPVSAPAALAAELTQTDPPRPIARGRGPPRG